MPSFVGAAYFCGQKEDMMIQFWDYMLRIGLAFLLGGLIGVERQYRRCNAGLRTNILVAVGSAAFTLLSCAMSRGSGDPSRIAAQIVSGIGFLGGGLILKEGVSVRGLNTAATIWCTAACGMLTGMGLYPEAAVLVSGVLVTHCLFRPLCRYIEKGGRHTCGYALRVECQKDTVDKTRQTIMNTLAYDRTVQIDALYYKEDGKLMVICCDIRTQGQHEVLLSVLVARLKALWGVVNVGWTQREMMQEEF